MLQESVRGGDDEEVGRHGEVRGRRKSDESERIAEEAETEAWPPSGSTWSCDALETVYRQYCLIVLPGLSHKRERGRVRTAAEACVGEAREFSSNEGTGALGALRQT